MGGIFIAGLHILRECVTQVGFALPSYADALRLLARDIQELGRNTGLRIKHPKMVIHGRVGEEERALIALPMDAIDFVLPNSAALVGSGVVHLRQRRSAPNQQLPCGITAQQPFCIRREDQLG
jgi:hypothetical protein